MSLNIKDEEVHRLARAIADATGQSMTRVIREALEERQRQLQAAQQKASTAELLALAREISTHAQGSYPDHGTALYDDRGLPA